VDVMKWKKGTTICGVIGVAMRKILINK